MNARCSSGRGFSLAELVIAIGLLLAAAAGIMSLHAASEHVFAAAPEAADAQQRLRVAASMLYRDLAQAGAGFSVGQQPGPLSRYIPALWPYRQDSRDGDRPGAFRPDAITVVYVPRTVAQSMLAEPMPAHSGWMTLARGPGCPPADAACGFRIGMSIVVVDATGAADRFSVQAVELDRLMVEHEGEDSAKIYESGSQVAEVVVRSYFLRTNPADGQPQLMRGRTAGGADVPVADHVVALDFAYFGRPVAGAGLLRIEPGTLTDGPWLPDGVSPNRFDSDLLRVRSVEVTLRVQSALAALRGPVSTLFARGGTSRDSRRWVPDIEIRFRVSPRNINLY